MQSEVEFKVEITKVILLSRLSWLGKERDKESGLGDHGVRKYDNISGRFLSIDPLWEKYLSWTPYQYSMNNPVNAYDVDGRAVKALDNQSRNDILNSLPSRIRSQIEFSRNGMINKESINNITSSDGNFNCLKALVNSSIIFNVENRSDILVKDMDGDGNNDSYPMGEAFKGFTATPHSSDGKYLSIYKDEVHVQINQKSDSKTRSKYIGHELFGHGYFFLIGKNFEHEYEGGVDQNIELKEFIFEREKNSEINHE